MYTFVEAWTPTQRWTDAPTEERAAFMAGIGARMESLSEIGVEVLAWCENDADTPQRDRADYFAVWRSPDLDAQRRFEQVIAEAGWYEYFDQHNLRGRTETPQDVLARHIGG